MPMFRKRPVTIEARLFDPGKDYDDACAVIGWCGGRAVEEGCEIDTLEGAMLARPGDMVVKGTHGEFYPVKPEIFAQTYEPASAVPDPEALAATGRWRPLGPDGQPLVSPSGTGPGSVIGEMMTRGSIGAAGFIPHPTVDAQDPREVDGG